MILEGKFEVSFKRFIDSSEISSGSRKEFWVRKKNFLALNLAKLYESVMRALGLMVVHTLSVIDDRIYNNSCFVHSLF
jgi:hypothetical protein